MANSLHICYITRKRDKMLTKDIINYKNLLSMSINGHDLGNTNHIGLNSISQIFKDGKNTFSFGDISFPTKLIDSLNLTEPYILNLKIDNFFELESALVSPRRDEAITVFRPKPNKNQILEENILDVYEYEYNSETIEINRPILLGSSAKYIELDLINEEEREYLIPKYAEPIKAYSGTGEILATNIGNIVKLKYKANHEVSFDLQTPQNQNSFTVLTESDYVKENLSDGSAKITINKTGTFKVFYKNSSSDIYIPFGDYVNITNTDSIIIPENYMLPNISYQFYTISFNEFNKCYNNANDSAATTLNRVGIGVTPDNVTFLNAVNVTTDSETNNVLFTNTVPNYGMSLVIEENNHYFTLNNNGEVSHKINDNEVFKINGSGAYYDNQKLISLEKLANRNDTINISTTNGSITLNPNGTTTYSNKITMNYSSIAHYVESPYIHFQANDGGYHKDLRFTYADGLTLDTERVLVESDVAKNKIGFKFNSLGITWDHPDDFFDRQSFNFTDGTLVATGDFPNALSMDTSANYVYFSGFNDLSTVGDEDGYRYYTTDEFMNDVVNGNYKLLFNNGTVDSGLHVLPVWQNHNKYYKLSGPIGRLNLYFFSFDVLIAYLKKTGDERYTHKILAEIDGFTVLQKDVVNSNRNFNHPLQLRADMGAVKYLHAQDFQNDHGLPPIDLSHLQKVERNGGSYRIGHKFYVNHLYLDLFATNLHPYKDTMIGFYDEFKTNYRYNMTYASVGNLTHDNTKRYEVTITIKLNASFAIIGDDEYLYFGFSFIPVDENNHIVGEKQSVYAKTFNMQIRDAKTMKIITSGNTKKLQVLYFLKNGALGGNDRADRVRASASLDVEVKEV
jgi:hypothetical protein